MKANPNKLRLLVILVLGLYHQSSQAQDDPQPEQPPPEEAPPPEEPASESSSSSSSSDSAPGDIAPAPQGAEMVPPGQELVNIDFPEPTEIKDIIRAVALWTGKNVILSGNVRGKVQMISPRKVTREEAYQAFLSALNVLGFTTVETGKIIKIMQINTALKGDLQIYQGSNWAPQTDKMITQIVPLKYIDAKQVQATLSRIVSTNSLIPYAPTNTLIISDTGFKVRRILAILELLDVQGQQPRVALVPIRYADAKSVADKVGELLKASDAARKGTAAGPAAGAGGSSYRVFVDERSNSVVIFGPPRTIADVKALVKQFDFPVDDPSNQAAIRVRFLDYADAKKLATTLSSLAQGGQRGARSSSLMPPPLPGAAGGGTRSNGVAPVAELGDNLKITAEESTNALLITGSRNAYDAINTIIRKLDTRRAQVYVEADILDVKVDSSFKFETSIFAASGSATGAKQIYGWQGSQVTPIIQSQLVDDIKTKSDALSSLSRDFTVGILSGAKIRLPGTNKDISPGALITMLKTDSNSRVLSSPHILTSNNEKAKILVGDKIFYKSAIQSTIAGGQALQKPEKEDVDLSLEIKPNVSLTSTYITLKVDLTANELSGISPEGLPSVGKRESSQLVTVKDGQTAVISGLVKRREIESYSKIPLLGDIPILGWLFRNSSTRKDQTNLMIFLTPHIVYGANDLAAIYDQKVKERDELMAQGFGTEDKTSDFMRALPDAEAGKYRPDAFDDLEKSTLGKQRSDARKDMGYTEAEIQALKSSDQAIKPSGAESAPPEIPAELLQQNQNLPPEGSIKKGPSGEEGIVPSHTSPSGGGDIEIGSSPEGDSGAPVSGGGDFGGGDIPAPPVEE